MFSSKLHFPVNLWPFICSMKVGGPPQSMWCSSSCYCKNNSRWLLNSRHIWEADPLGLHSCVRWELHIIVCGNVGKQQQSMYLKEDNVHFEVWDGKWCVCPPNALCFLLFVISHSESSQGRRKVQLPPSLTVSTESRAVRKLIHLAFSLNKLWFYLWSLPNFDFISSLTIAMLFLHTPHIQ